MNEKLKKLAEFISSQDNETKKKIAKMEVDELITYAAENGITVTAEELKEAEKEAKERAAKAKNAEGELSDDELDAVAGGDVCVCAVGGGGAAVSYGYDDLCVCVVSGLGSGEDDDGHKYNRCGCIVGGGGSTFEE